MKKALQTKIAKSNIGYEMLMKMGYQEGQGLGKDGKGMVEPLPLNIKTDRKGLGTATAEVREQKKANAGPQKSHPKRKTAEKKAAAQAKVQALMATDQAVKALVAAEKAKELAIKAQQFANQLNVTPATATAAKDVPPKHSPIRATSTAPTPPEIKKIDASDSQFLKSLLTRYKTEIKRMQLSLKPAPPADSKDEIKDVIVAKIRFDNDDVITEDVFEFIRIELVGWIGVYQEQDLDTPIFHSMNNNTRHITVVCDDDYAYTCLEQCVEDMSKDQIMNRLHVLRLPPITPSIYCYEAIYEGVAQDPSLLLHQIKLHKRKLLSESWVVVSHEVCSQTGRTYFIFLIDERSALALEYQYSSSFCICMQTLSFRNCGLVTENHLN